MLKRSASEPGSLSALVNPFMCDALCNVHVFKENSEPYGSEIAIALAMLMNFN